MKKITLFVVMMLAALNMSAQANIISTSFYSQALNETKAVHVFLPPGYDENPDLYYPVIYYLHGWQGAQNSGDEIMNTANSMINQGLIDPVMMVCAHNSPPPFGGSVYANSILWGDYETYMVEDLCNWIESTYRAMPGKHYRAVFGTSMGGYGAFRYGILHNDKYCALAACAGPVSFLEDNMCMQFRQMILQANQGPPYTYTFATGGPFTQIYFLYYGAFTPNYNTPQTYINPAILEFPLDENGNYIDTILTKVKPNDIANLINQLTPENSPGIYFGCGITDQFFLYQGNLDVKDSLELYGIPYTFYSHGGGHIMPAEFTQNAFLFLDSLLLSPVIPCSCLPEGITLTTPEEIENFQIDYLGCREIEGGATIMGGGITNLNGLSVLTSIGGELTIAKNYQLTSLNGLQHIQSIGGSFSLGVIEFWGSNQYIVGNKSLTDLSGLDALNSVGGDLFIGGLDSLTSLAGLQNLNDIGGNLQISLNKSLINLTGLEGLTSVEGNVKIGGSFFNGSGNASLIDLTGLENLTSIGGNLLILDNSNLTSLTGIDSIAAGSIIDLSISNNAFLSTCEVTSICEYLAAPNGTVTIQNNAPGCDSQEEVLAACMVVIEEEFRISNSEFRIIVYPNPVSDQLTLDCSSVEETIEQVAIYNIYGALVEVYPISGQQSIITLDMSGLPSGVYFYRLSAKGSSLVISGKLIKH